MISRVHAKSNVRLTSRCLQVEVRQPAVHVLYASKTGTCRRLAQKLEERLRGAQLHLSAASAKVPVSSIAASTAAQDSAACGTCGKPGGPCAAPAQKHSAGATAAATPIQLSEISAYEPESLLSEAAGSVVVVILPTYEGGVPPESAAFFCEWLAEASTDFRLGSGALVGLRYCVAGAGNSLYAENFNAVAKRADKQLLALGAQRVTGPGARARAHGQARTPAILCTFDLRMLHARINAPHGTSHAAFVLSHAVPSALAPCFGAPGAVPGS